MTHVRRRLLAASISAAVGGLILGSVATPAFAQNKTGDDAQKLEAIQVTGSRIKKAEVEGQTPVITITAKDIEQTGLGSIGDVIQQLSVSGSSLNTKFNSAGNFGFAPDGSGVGSGSTTISLRNLNPKRTLILVDGLRWINESSASGVSAAVDLNTIPAGIVERIEILTDGASSLYGSDAIAGVVNIITKKSQDGAALHAYYGDYSVGDGKTYSGDISFGGKGDRYSFFVDISHYKQNRISSADFAQGSAECVPGTGLANCSSATPFTRVLFDTPGGVDFGGLCPGGFCSITANGVAPTGGVQNFPSGYHHFARADRFNFAPFNLLLTPSERTGFFAQTEYKVTDNVNWYMKGLYNTRKSTNQAGPEPIFLGQAFCFLIDRCYTVSVDKTNPYNPFGFTLDANDPVHGADFGLGRRPIEGGPRVFSQTVDTRYFATGLTGNFAAWDRNFNWDVNVVRADNDATQDVTGTYNIAHIAKGVGPLADCQADPNCVPVNLFGGPGTLTPAMLNYILYHEHDTSHQSLGVFTANISGDLFQLPAGSLDFAAGYEYRDLTGKYQPDAVVVAGDSNGVPSKPTAGSYNVGEVYVELNAPLVADAPFAKHFDLSLATRYSDYSTFGGTTNSKLGLRWQLNDDLTFRGTYAQGFRAPSIGELFGTFSRFDATLNDPCNNATGVRATNCATLGVPNPATFQQSNPQISVLTGGNPNLQPEKSKNTTLGAIYSPSWAENASWAQKLDFELTYYRITVKNAIQAKDAQTLLNRCADTLDPAFCALQSRNGAGFVTFLNDTLGNLGRVQTNGFDFGVNWIGPDTSWGKPSASWQSTYVNKYNAVSVETGLPEPQGVGIEVTDSGIARIRSTLRLGWAVGDWTASWAFRYMSGLTEDCAGAGGFPICPNPASAKFPDGSHKLGATTYDDVRLSWKVPTELPFTVAGGVNNVFAHDPPVCLSCSLNGYDASNYDLPGRFWYVEASIKF
jgi:iron complex outermembrane receptor protein